MAKVDYKSLDKYHQMMRRHIRRAQALREIIIDYSTFMKLVPVTDEREKSNKNHVVALLEDALRYLNAMILDMIKQDGKVVNEQGKLIGAKYRPDPDKVYDSNSYGDIIQKETTNEQP